MAWQKLCAHCEPELAAREGQAMQEFTALTSNKSKRLKETRKLITELEQKAKAWAELSQDQTRISESHKKSVLAGLLGPETTAHTHKDQGKPFNEFKAAVLQFINTSLGPIEEKTGELNADEKAGRHMV